MKKTDLSISISLTDKSLKIAQTKGTGRALKVTNIVARNVEGVTDEELPKIIQGALSGFNTKSANIFCVIPSSQTTTKNVEIPSINDDEIRSIVSLQAGRHTPFSRDEIQVGYINIGVYKNNFTKVLLIIVNKNIIKRQLDIFSKVGLKIEKVLFSSEGVAGLYSDIVKDDYAPIGVIDIGKNSTEFVITYKGKAITSRSIPVGLPQITENSKESNDKLIDELGKTIELYQSEDIEAVPTKFILTSDDDTNRNLLDSIKVKLNWDVDIVPYVDNIKASKGVLNLLATEYGDLSALDIISSAVITKDANVNLMPEEIQMKKYVEDQGHEVFMASILGLIILIVVGSWLGLRIFFHNSFLTKLKENYKSNRQEVEKLEDQAIRSKIIQDYLANRMVSLDTINELYDNIPNEIYLTNIFMDEDGSISIQGVSDIASLVFNLGTTLKEAEFFKSVNIKSTTAKKDRGKDVSAFEITLKLKSAEEDEDVLSIEPEE